MRHPPFNPGPVKGATDFCTLAGAQRLAALIREAWARCGHDVLIKIEPSMPGHKNTTYAIRLPGLVNGLPTR